MFSAAVSISRYFSKSWDIWTLVLLVIATALFPQGIFPLSKGRLFICFILLIIGHINKHKLGVRIGFMISGLLIGVIFRLV